MILNLMGPAVKSNNSVEPTPTKMVFYDKETVFDDNYRQQIESKCDQCVICTYIETEERQNTL